MNLDLTLNQVQYEIKGDKKPHNIFLKNVFTNWFDLLFYHIQSK